MAWVDESIMKCRDPNRKLDPGKGTLSMVWGYVYAVPSACNMYFAGIDEFWSPKSNYMMVLCKKKLHNFSPLQNASYDGNYSNSS